MKSLFSNYDHWSIFSVLAALNVLDAATTAILVAKYGASVEANPIMRHAIVLYGIPGLYMMKFAVVAFLGLVISWVVQYYREHRAYKIAKRSMVILCALLLLIVVNNTILVALTINT